LFLFIFENFGTQELLLVGVVALILLGPRRMPEMARKIGKMMAEFKGTANEFKETWQREVNFEEEAKALDLNALEAETVERTDSTGASNGTEAAVEPLVQPIDPAMFEQMERMHQSASKLTVPAPHDEQQKLPLETSEANDKKNWF